MAHATETLKTRSLQTHLLLSFLSAYTMPLNPCNPPTPFTSNHRIIPLPLPTPPLDLEHLSPTNTTTRYTVSLIASNTSPLRSAPLPQHPPSSLTILLSFQPVRIAHAHQPHLRSLPPSTLPPPFPSIPLPTTFISTITVQKLSVLIKRAGALSF